MLYPEFYPAAIPKAVMIAAERMGVPESVLQAYQNKVVEHITYVQEEGFKLGVPAQQLQRHDMTKFSPVEYFAYAKHFHGEDDPAEFALAWLHHLHHNEHHWQHWLLPGGDFKLENSNVVNGALPMPSHFALEMVADWIGAGRAYTGSDDMTEWLTRNVPRITLHPQTAAYVGQVLEELGYGVNFAWGSAIGAQDAGAAED